MIFTRAFLVLSVLLSLSAPASAAPVYDARLSGFDYPHPVRLFPLASQGQALEMAYMDVAPQGTANGRTAVLLHGKNFCAATWRDTISALAGAGYRVIAPDQIGFCKSSKPRGYQFSFNQLAANTDALLQSLGIEKATIIGHSIGGMLAARYAIQYPARTERLVLVNPIGLEDWQAKGVPYASIDTLYEGELKTSFDSIKAYQQRMYYNGEWKPAYDEWVSMLAGMYAGRDKKIVAWNQAQTSDMLFSQPVVYELNRIAAPTLLLIGGRDRTAPGSNRAPEKLAAQLGNYPMLARRAAVAIPDAKLVMFRELGHSPQIEAPDVFHKALLAGLNP